jgi:hypothetical protein
METERAGSRRWENQVLVEMDDEEPAVARASRVDDLVV